MNYIIEYTVRSKKGVVLKSGKMKVKNKGSGMEAQVKLEEFLKKRYSDFGRLIVYKCTEDTFSDIFGDIFGSNPFNL